MSISTEIRSGRFTVIDEEENSAVDAGNRPEPIAESHTLDSHSQQNAAHFDASAPYSPLVTEDAVYTLSETHHGVDANYRELSAVNQFSEVQTVTSPDNQSCGSETSVSSPTAYAALSSPSEYGSATSSVPTRRSGRFTVIDDEGESSPSHTNSDLTSPTDEIYMPLTQQLQFSSSDEQHSQPLYDRAISVPEHSSRPMTGHDETQQYQRTMPFPSHPHAGYDSHVNVGDPEMVGSPGIDEGGHSHTGSVNDSEHIVYDSQSQYADTNHPHSSSPPVDVAHYTTDDVDATITDSGPFDFGNPLNMLQLLYNQISNLMNDNAVLKGENERLVQENYELRDIINQQQHDYLNNTIDYQQHARSQSGEAESTMVNDSQSQHHHSPVQTAPRHLDAHFEQQHTEYYHTPVHTNAEFIRPPSIQVPTASDTHSASDTSHVADVTGTATTETPSSAASASSLLSTQTSETLPIIPRHSPKSNGGIAGETVAKKKKVASSATTGKPLNNQITNNTSASTAAARKLSVSNTAAASNDASTGKKNSLVHSPAQRKKSTSSNSAKGGNFFAGLGSSDLLDQFANAALSSICNNLAAKKSGSVADGGKTDNGTNSNTKDAVTLLAASLGLKSKPSDESKSSGGSSAHATPVLAAAAAQPVLPSLVNPAAAVPMSGRTPSFDDVKTFSPSPMPSPTFGVLARAKATQKENSLFL